MRVGNELSAQQMAQLGPVRVHAVNDVRTGADQGVKARFAVAYLGLRLDACGNVAKVANHAVAAVRQRDAVDLPFVVRGSAAVEALGDQFFGLEGLARRERVAELLHDVIGARCPPDVLHHRCQIATDEARDIAELGQSQRVDLADTQLGVHQADAQRRHVDQGFKLCSKQAQGFCGLLAFG